MIRSKAIIIMLSAAWLTAGCASGLINEKAAPVQYRIDYDSPGVQAHGAFDKGLRVWKFSASKPYDGREMVVLSSAREVSSSSRFQWIAQPGDLLADRLTEDMAAGGLFTHVVASTSPEPAPLELSGHIYTFAWQRRNNGSYAVLEVQMTLSDAGKSVLFQKRYHLQSASTTDYSPEAFAAAMSGLVRDLSVRVQRDLAALARDG